MPFGLPTACLLPSGARRLLMCPCQSGESAHSWLMPEPRRIARHIIDVLLIFAPLSGMLYFLFDPAAFNAFLAWLVSVL